jgi:hypothetical protein
MSRTSPLLQTCETMSFEIILNLEQREKVRETAAVFAVSVNPIIRWEDFPLAVGFLIAGS